MNNLKTEQIRMIILHCSATRSNMSYTVQQLERDHRARGFRTVGYHYYIYRSGQVVQCRSLNECGAHTRGYNHCSIGICYEGGLSPQGVATDTRTQAQKEALLQLLKQLKQRFPHAVILGHRDLSRDLDGDGRISPYEYMKACPCFDAIPEYAHLHFSTL